ncbi:aspartate/glutamate racemase family protein [Serratia sp. M24T3]|uniref:aspartate/glutamate racemase family protein n=1 Tax=Serratia sp. M24T3 TaxID=932213 RepID=UPI00025B991F|nr:aspartate/glutamate racemase family protein [Serratia sp. M24T3]EIC83821.1 hydantoin racemase [Serratia sp. M24T3]
MTEKLLQQETKARVALIRVVTSEDQSFLDIHQQLIIAEQPELAMTTYCLADQYDGIHDAKTFELAVPKLVAMGLELQKNYDILLVSCASDPAVKQLRQLLSIPVVGVGQACCEQALTVSQSVGAIGIEPRAPAIFYEVLHDRLRTYRQPKGVNNTHDIHTEDGKAAIIEAVLACEKDGAKVIALACTGMATTDVAALVAPYTSIAIINPVLAAGLAVKKLLKR